MNDDAKVCYCFHVTKRKLLNYLRSHKMRVASQFSECGGAGTGCGWCVPFLQQLFEQRAQGDLETLTPEEYARRRARYLEQKKHNSPPPEQTENSEDS